MKLHAEDVAGFEQGRERLRVSARRCRRLADWNVVAVREVNVRLALAVQQSRGLHGAQRVPPHVRDARASAETLHAPFEDAEPLDLRRLCARFEQRLKPEADPEERNATRDAFLQRAAQLQGVERAHHLAKVADAGQQDFVAATQPVRIAHHFKACVDCLQRVLHGAQVPCAVIEHRDHSSPFVLGS